MKKLTFIIAIIFSFAFAACSDGTRQENAGEQNRNTELGSENLGEEEMDENQQMESDTSSFEEMDQGQQQEQRPEL